MYEDLQKDLIRKANSKVDEIIRDAFKEHFGFPLEIVTDKENLEILGFPGSPILEFRYRNTPFLLWKKSDDFTMVDAGQCDIKITMQGRFLKV